MATIQSKLNTTDESFKNSKANMQDLIKQLEQHQHVVKNSSSKRSIQRQHEQGKLLVRNRIDLLIDDNTSFFELSTMAGYDLYDDKLPAGGIITGIGIIENTHCIIIANDATVKGGSYYPITVKKHLRAQEIAQQHKLPCIYLVDSGGAFLPKQDEVFPDKNDFGRIFYNQAQLSAQNIAQIAIVMGSCTAGGAYIPAMADISIIVKEQGTIFLGGPPLVKAATGEIVTSEQLGGADVHCRSSGVADYYANNDQHALEIARTSVRHLNIPKIKPTERGNKPKHDAEELLGLIPIDTRMPIEMREIIARIVDDSDFDEFKQLFGKTIICGFAHINNHLVGVIANNGILFSEAALKGTQFIQLCNQRKIPLIFLQNTNGFMIGKHHETTGIAKHGAKMVMAVACSQVPKFTVIVGGSYGAGNYAMCGRAYSPNLLLTWPNARISVMGGEQAANVLTDIKREQLARGKQTWADDEMQNFNQSIRDIYEQQGNAYYASSRLWDDGIINPLHTRSILTLALDISKHLSIAPTKYGVFRM